MRTVRVLFVIVAAILVVTPLAAESQQRTLVNRLLYSKNYPFGGLRAAVPENEGFFEHRISSGNLAAIRDIIGKNTFEDVRFDDAEGKSVEIFLTDYREILQQNPSALTALARDVTRSDDVTLRLHEEDGGRPGESIDIAEPATIISAQDIYTHTQGPNAGPRAFRDFLSNNFGLENQPPRKRPDQIAAYSVFNNIVSGLNRNDIDANGIDTGEPGLPDSNDSSRSFDYLTDHFVRDARPNDSASAPGTNAPGLFLPSKSTLDSLKSILQIYQELKFAQDEHRAPSLAGFDSRALDSLMQIAGVSDASQLATMSLDDLKKHVTTAATRVVSAELERNDYVYEQSGVAHVGGTEPVGGDESENAAYAGAVQPTFTAGNTEATSEIQRQREEFFHAQTEASRTRREIEHGIPWHLSISPEDVQRLEQGGKVYHIFGPNMRDGFLNLPNNPRLEE